MKKEINKKAVGKFNRRNGSPKVWIEFKKSFIIAILILGLLGLSQGVEAQKYPTRPITILINAQPGAGIDVGSRLIAQGATKILGQEIIPANKTGGGGAVAAMALVSGKADGYTLLGTASDQLVNHPQLESVAYDLEDFTPIIQYGIINVATVVNSDSPHKSFKDLIDFARKNPGKVSYSSPQFGTNPHLAIEYIMLEEKVNIAIIPYMGGTPAMTALLGGHVSACITSTSSFISHFKAGKVRPLVTITISGKRLEAMPDVPTLSELGYSYGDAFTSIYLIAAPKGTPTDVVKTLDEAFRRAMETPEFLNYAKSNYLYVENPLSGQDLKEFLKDKYQKIGEVIRKAKLGKK